MTRRASFQERLIAVPNQPRTYPKHEGSRTAPTAQKPRPELNYLSPRGPGHGDLIGMVLRSDPRVGMQYRRRHRRLLRRFPTGFCLPGGGTSGETAGQQRCDSPSVRTAWFSAGAEVAFGRRPSLSNWLPTVRAVLRDTAEPRRTVTAWLRWSVGCSVGRKEDAARDRVVDGRVQSGDGAVGDRVDEAAKADLDLLAQHAVSLHAAVVLGLAGCLEQHDGATA